MSIYSEQPVLAVHHWNNTLFSFKAGRPPELRFESGHFVMIGLHVDSKPLTRAYSIASATYDEHLEFLSIKVQNGPLASRLQHLQVGDTILVGRKPVGTLMVTDLRPGKNLYLFGSGTGLAPFMSIIQDPFVYERFEKIVLVHCVRWVSELTYQELITRDLPEHQLVGQEVCKRLIYYPPSRGSGFVTKGGLPI